MQGAKGCYHLCAAFHALAWVMSEGMLVHKGAGQLNEREGSTQLPNGINLSQGDFCQLAVAEVLSATHDACTPHDKCAHLTRSELLAPCSSCMHAFKHYDEDVGIQIEATFLAPQLASTALPVNVDAHKCCGCVLTTWMQAHF
eukprot:1160272-Pelagomonas_calceolata.AAC.4